MFVSLMSSEFYFIWYYFQAHSPHSASPACSDRVVVTGEPALSSSISCNAFLTQPHRLSLEWHIQCKLATLTFKALHTGRQSYLTDCLQCHQLTKFACSSSSHQLFIPGYNLSFGFRAFHFSAPQVWNSLLLRICES